MRISELHKAKVTVLEDHHPSYQVKCDVCAQEWSLLLNTKGTIRREEWKCLMCHPLKSWLDGLPAEG